MHVASTTNNVTACAALAVLYVMPAHFCWCCDCDAQDLTNSDNRQPQVHKAYWTVMQCCAVRSQVQTVMRSLRLFEMILCGLTLNSSSWSAIVTMLRTSLSGRGLTCAAHAWACHVGKAYVLMIAINTIVMFRMQCLGKSTLSIWRTAFQ